MNHPRKQAAIKKHFSVQYQSLEEMKAGLKADESGYTDAEIEEIVEGIRQKAAEASQGAAPDPKSSTVVSPEAMKEALSGLAAEERKELEELREFKKKQAAAPTKALAEKIAGHTTMQDFDVFFGDVKKEKKVNPFNPESPHTLIIEIVLGQKATETGARIEKHLAHQFNEFAINSDVNWNHGGTPTSQFYLPAGKYRNGDHISYSAFAAFQSEDKEFKKNYDPQTNISLLYKAMQLGQLTN